MGADVVSHKSQIYLKLKIAKRTKKVGIVGKYETRYVNLSERISRSLKFRVILNTKLEKEDQEN